MANIRRYERKDGTVVRSHSRNVSNSYNSKFKEFLNKEAPSSYHLPIETAIYIPSTGKKQLKISSKEYQARINKVKRFLSSLYGGFSSVSITGGYTLDNGGIIQEDITRVVAFSTEQDYKANKSKVLLFLKQLSKEWYQESMGYEFEGDLYYISY